jgi:CRISPR/Cas system-associated exonuclease Cas4 (RecB family)
MCCSTRMMLCPRDSWLRSSAISSMTPILTDAQQDLGRRIVLHRFHTPSAPYSRKRT